MNLIYEGKSKKLFDAGGEHYLMVFKDEVTAGDGARRDLAPGKGELAAKTSAALFKAVSDIAETHYVEYRPPNALLVKKADIIPVEVIVRLYAYGSFLKRMPHVPPLKRLTRPIVEFHLKNDALHDPLVLEQDIAEAGLASEEEIKAMREISLKVAQRLESIFARAGAQFIDAKFEFGRRKNELVLADEISGDTIRVLHGGEHLDKEYYRKTGDAAGLVQRYKKLYQLVEEALGRA